LAADESPIGPREGLPVVSWEQAGDVMGREAVIFGRIVDVGDNGRIHFLNFSKDDPAAFKLVVFEHALNKFSQPLRDVYLNRLVEVHGHVSRYAGNPQIVVGSPQQIRVVAKLPPTVLPKVPQYRLGEELTLASYNVLNLFDGVDDPYRADESTPAKPRGELQQVAAVLRRINADVIALQEVENRGYLQRFLDVFLPDLGYRHVALVEGNDPRGIDVCLVSRIPLGRVVSHRHLRFQDDQGNWHAFNRDLLRVEVLPPNGVPFEVWVVHLKSKGGGENSDPIRLAEARQVGKLLDARLQEDPSVALVVCGDFNDTYDSASLEAILRDDQNAPRLMSLFETIPESGRITYNLEPYREMIDFIFCTPAMAEQYVPGSYAIHAGTLEETGSDHNPVVCRFRRREAAASWSPSRKF
jgi:endonuclease/exonuclease/phosphatase family metal-dependent hydrolase